MALTDAQVDAQIAQQIASYEGRILLAQLAATTLNVELAAAQARGDVQQGFFLAQQILAQQQDISILTAAATELAKIGGKVASGRKAKNSADAAVVAARAFVVANPLVVDVNAGLEPKLQ